MVVGEVTGWLPAEGEDKALWRVQHMDGDEEALELEELTKVLVPQEEERQLEPPVVSQYVNDARGCKRLTVTQV